MVNPIGNINFNFYTYNDEADIFIIERNLEIDKQWLRDKRLKQLLTL